ncbi:MAG: molybdate ABC transporter permease subunit [Bacteroidota bacterium]
MDWTPIILSFQLAGLTSVLLLVIGIPIAYLLAYSSFKGKILLEALLGMPLVLPPTVLGFYFLLFFSTEGGFGKWMHDVFGLNLIFSFEGLLIASVIYSLPFMVQPLQAGFSSVDTKLIEAAESLGKGRWEILWRVLLPLIKPSLLSGWVLSFAHTIGEFGVVLMMGGSIPGRTKVASIAVYEEVEKLNYEAAHEYSFILFALCFVLLLILYGTNRSTLNPFHK